MYGGLTEANDSFCLLKTSVREKFPQPSTINNIITYSIPKWTRLNLLVLKAVEFCQE